MAKRISKSTLRKAKIAREASYNEAVEDFEARINDARANGDNILTGELEARLDELMDEQRAGDSRQKQRAEARRDNRRARQEASGTCRPRIQWADGGRAAAPGRQVKKMEFAQAIEAGLAKVSREISRWEMGYDTPRGLRAGEIVMIISETYQDGKKWVVDIMSGADVIKGVPAKALRNTCED